MMGIIIHSTLGWYSDLMVELDHWAARCKMVVSSSADLALSKPGSLLLKKSLLNLHSSLSLILSNLFPRSRLPFGSESLMWPFFNPCTRCCSWLFNLATCAFCCAYSLRGGGITRGMSERHEASWEILWPRSIGFRWLTLDQTNI